jgi:hypothetical protein
MSLGAAIISYATSMCPGKVSIYFTTSMHEMLTHPPHLVVDKKMLILPQHLEVEHEMLTFTDHLVV